MPASTKRAPKGTKFPSKKTDVPAWLAKAYGIDFIDEETPDIPGWGLALSRAESLLHNPEFAWLESLNNLATELEAAQGTRKEAAIKLNRPGISRDRIT